MKEPALAWPPPWLRENRIGDFGVWASGRQSDRKGYACATNTLLQSFGGWTWFEAFSSINPLRKAHLEAGAGLKHIPLLILSEKLT